MSDVLQRINPDWLLFIGVFLGVLLLVEGLRQLLSRRETTDEARSRRMRMVSAGTDIQERLDILAPQRKSRLAGGSLDLRGCFWLPGCRPAPARSSSQRSSWPELSRSGFRHSSRGRWPSSSPRPSPSHCRCWCSSQFVRSARNVSPPQLPDALDLMARGLRAGHPLNTSIANVAETMPDPIGTEFGIVVDSVTYGEEITKAMQKLGERNPSEDFTYLAAAIAIQHESGGQPGTGSCNSVPNDARPHDDAS